MRMPRLVVSATLVVVASLGLTGCSIAENALGGAIGEVRGGVDDAISEALGGAGIATNGELPNGFPSEAVPLTGEIVGGGSGPDATGWVVQTRFGSASDFAAAQQALEGSGFASSAVDSDADSGFGTFTSDAYTVVLTVATGSDDVVTATYVVTPA